MTCACRLAGRTTWLLLAATSVLASTCGGTSGRDGTGAGTMLAGPSDLAELNEQPWRRLHNNGWQYLRRSSSKDPDIVEDPSAPFSPPHVLRVIFTPDMGRDREPSVHWTALPNAREVSAAWWIKLSANWSPSPAGGGKMTFLHAAPNGQGQVYTALRGSSAPHWVIVNTEWAPYGQRIWEPNATRTPILYDRWYRIEWHMKWPSTPGGRNEGTLRWWVDGALNGEYANVIYPGGGIGFHQFEFAPTLQNPPRSEQYMYIDHTKIGIQ